MEHHSLQSASVYLNNLLLARGLLRTGKSIDFARPEKASAGTDATMAKIINLVHDLVLRRDRDAEQRETLAVAVRALRTNESQQSFEMERVQAKCADLTRNMAAAEAQERILKASVRKAETSVKELKEQVQKIKSTLEQTRSKCQSDVRKRDIDLEKLKAHLVNLQRGKREGTGMNVISIAPHLKDSKPHPDVGSADYSLEQESNAFLASFVKSLNADLESLSGEHRWLLYLIKRTKQELEDMMGGGPDECSDSGLGLSKQKVLPPSSPTTPTIDELAGEMTRILEHCGSILNNPSYVSIEEVEIRETEIVKLREGWEKMANRLKEALTMMDTWRRRMIDGGENVNIEELGMGMDLGKSIAVPQVGGENGVVTDPTSLFDDEQEGLTGIEEVEEESSEQGGNARTIKNELEQAQLDGAAQTKIADKQDTNKHYATSPARRGFCLPKPVPVLKQSDGNIQRQSPVKQTISPREVSFPDDSELDSEDEGSIDFNDLLAQEAAKVSTSKNLPPRRSNGPTAAQLARKSPEAFLASEAGQRYLDQFREETAPPESGDKISMAEKLARVEGEAQEAQNESAAYNQSKKRKITPGMEATTGLKRNRGGTKGRHGNRRRSTLSGEELQRLMGTDEERLTNPTSLHEFWSAGFTRRRA